MQVNNLSVFVVELDGLSMWWFVNHNLASKVAVVEMKVELVGLMVQWFLV